MKSIFRATISLALIANLAGCYSMTYSANTLPNGSVSMSREDGAKVVRHFEAEGKAVWLLNGLIPLTSLNVPTMIRAEVGERPVRSLMIHSEQSFTDGLITVLISLGLGLAVAGANPTGNPTTSSILGLVAGVLTPQLRTIRVEGDVVELAPAK